MATMLVLFIYCCWNEFCVSLHLHGDLCFCHHYHYVFHSICLPTSSLCCFHIPRARYDLQLKAPSTVFSKQSCAAFCRSSIVVATPVTSGDKKLIYVSAKASGSNMRHHRNSTSFLWGLRVAWSCCRSVNCSQNDINWNIQTSSLNLIKNYFVQFEKAQLIFVGIVLLLNCHLYLRWS